MAASAALVRRIDHAVGGGIGYRNALFIICAEIARARVAFQTQLADGISNEQRARSRAMGLVTGDATVCLLDLVLEQERSLLVDVALEARLLAVHAHVEHFGRLSHAKGRREPAVGVVTIGAFHQAFIDTMFGGHGELSPHIAVALITQFGLNLSEKILIGCRMMIGVTLRAGDIVLRMFRPPNVGTVEILRMARQTCLDNLLWFHERESSRNRRPSTTRQDVGSGWSMAAFAGCELRRFLTGCKALEMRVLIEHFPLRRVALPAFFIPGELALVRVDVGGFRCASLCGLGNAGFSVHLTK